MKGRALLAAGLLAASSAGAQEVHTYALVSAVGSTLTYVKPRLSVGTHLEPYQRAELKVPDTSLDVAVLKGVEKTIRQADPDAKFVYLRLNPAEFAHVDAPKKGEVAVGKLASAFESMPARRDWYQIVVVTPRYVASEREGLGSKLSGIGIYVQPVEKTMVGVDGTVSMESNNDASDRAVTPGGESVRASSYIAPYFYTRLWILDAATLAVVQASERFEYQRIRDPSNPAVHIEAEVPPEKLGPMVETFVEEAAAKMAREAIGVVTVGEPKVVPSKP